MKSNERTIHILHRLRQDHYAAVEELSQALGVSQMTIRRDLQELEAIGIVARTHGGALLRTERGDVEWPLSIREGEHQEAKRRIGQTAALLIQDGDVVVMDSGSTALQVASHLTQNRLTVASNFLPILDSLADHKNISLVGIGGTFHADNKCFCGPLAINTIRSINANVAIMATSCLSLSKGMSNRNINEAETKKAMIATAEKVILVMDSSKMGHYMLASVGPLEAIDILVTDDGLTAEDRTAIEARGVQVIVAP